MTSANASLLGIAKQTAKGTPNITDNAFKYLLFTQGAVAPNSVTIPLDPEVGGGALLRDIKKVGVFSGGGLEMIPRPETLGTFLMGAFGNVVSVVEQVSAYKHTFTLGADQFNAPYYTVRSAPGNLWGEQLQDVRINALGLEFRGANFVRGQVGMIGGLPAKVSTAAWAASTKVDSGPQFIAPTSVIELPTGAPIKVLAGGFSAGMAIPLDQQWIIGSYSPDAMDIVQRAFAVNFLVKIDDATLYTKMTYDPAGGSAWVASLFREALFKIDLVSDVMAVATTPYSLSITGNGLSTAAANVVWTAQPVGSRAGQQITMAVSGMFLASDTPPITAVLINTTASY